MIFRFWSIMIAKSQKITKNLKNREKLLFYFKLQKHDKTLRTRSPQFFNVSGSLKVPKSWGPYHGGSFSATGAVTVRNSVYSYSAVHHEF